MLTRFIPNDEVAGLYKSLTLTFPGGSLTASRDVLASIFKDDALPSTCNPEVITVSRKESTRTRYPGDSQVRIVPSTTYELKNYGSGESSLAAGGEAIRFNIDGSWWTARLTGTHQDFMDYLCANTGSLEGNATYWISAKGRKYFVAHSEANDIQP